MSDNKLPYITIKILGDKEITEEIKKQIQEMLESSWAEKINLYIIGE